MAAEARPYHGARAVQPVFPLPVLPRAGTAHSPAAPPPSVLSLTPFLAAPAGPGSEPGSGYCGSAKRTRGRGKYFRGNGPRVGVCKLASVPAGQRRPRGWHGALGPGGGAARRGRLREAAPGRFLKQIVNFNERIQLENQDWQAFSSDHRQDPGRVQGFLEHPSSPWRTLSSV